MIVFKGRLRRSRRLSLSRGALILALALGAGHVARSADAPPISIELNKLEPQSKACRVFIVVANPTDATFQSLKLDLVFFRTDGVIDRRLSADLGPVRPAKTSIKIFDIDGLSCDTVGSILVNDALDCRDTAGPVAECLGRLKFSSRAGVTFSQ